jgi:hypothetical protein
MPTNRVKTSIYTGVSYNKNRKKWEAKFVYNKKLYYLGYHMSEYHAAIAIDNKRMQLGIPSYNEI